MLFLQKTKETKHLVVKGLPADFKDSLNKNFNKTTIQINGEKCHSLEEVSEEEKEFVKLLLEKTKSKITT